MIELLFNDVVETFLKAALLLHALLSLLNTLIPTLLASSLAARIRISLLPHLQSRPEGIQRLNAHLLQLMALLPPRKHKSWDFEDACGTGWVGVIYLLQAVSVIPVDSGQPVSRFISHYKIIAVGLLKINRSRCDRLFDLLVVIYNMIGTALIITLLVSVAAATPSLAQQQRIYPHIVEYIPAFSLAANDLQRLTVNQFKQITIGDVITTAYEVHTTQVILSYDGKSKHIQRPSPLKVLVTNDSFHLNIQFQVKVIHAVGSKSYSCSVQAPQVIVNYTKEVDFASGNTLITSLTSSYSSASFSQAVCQGTVGKNDKGAIESAVRSEGSSIYVQLKKTIDRMQSYMSINAGEERLSKIYAQNPYTYDFYGFRMDVNVSTVQATPFGETGIENSILGGIPFSTYPALPPPPYEQGFSSFYSLEFMRGMIEYTSSNYGAWRELRLTRSNMRTKVFQFRLLDFEPIMPSVLKRYPNKYLADVDICCAVQEIGEVTLDQQKLYVGIGWRCTGGFEGQDNNRVVFLNFLLRLKHSVQFTVASTSLSVRVSDLEIEGLEFEYIDEHKVVDPFTVGEYIRQDLFEFKVLTVGTFFKIASPNLKKKLIPERGMWIG